MNIPKIQISSLYFSGLLLLVYSIGENDDIAVKVTLLIIYCAIYISLVMNDEISVVESYNKLPSKKDYVFVWDQSDKIFLYTRFVLEEHELEQIRELSSVSSLYDCDDFISITTKKIFFKKEIEAQISAILEKRKLINQ